MFLTFVWLLPQASATLPRAAFVLGECGWAMEFAWVTRRAAVGFGGVAGRIMTMPILLFLGKLSYGLYLYHFFVPNQVLRVAGRLQIGLPTNEVVRFMIYSGISILVAAASFYVLENPINKLKVFVPYVRPGEKSATPIALQ